jgi:hypothetical protein
MKKFMYVLTLMFAMVLMSTSCEKQNDTPDSTVKTLEQTYPAWKNLKWEVTDNDFTPAKYPKLSITIVGDVVTITKKISATQSIIGKYNKMTAPSTIVTFTQVVDDFNGLGSTLTCTGVTETIAEITLTCLGNTYILVK